MHNYQDFIDYMQNLAENHVEINHSAQNKHFVKINASQYLNQNISNILDHCMALEDYDGTVDGENNNLKDTIHIGFSIAKHVQEDNWTQFDEARAWAKKIGFDILFRMYEDKKLYNKAVAGFDITTAEYMPVGPMWDNFVGMRFTFKIKQPIGNCFDESKWNDV